MTLFSLIVTSTLFRVLFPTVTLILFPRLSLFFFPVVTRVVRRSTFGTNAIPRQGRESERKEGGVGGGRERERERKKECV